MRHRAPRPVLARLKSFAATPRNAAVALALLTAGAATGAVLTVADAPESARTGSPTAGPPAATQEAVPGLPTPGSPTPATEPSDAGKERADRSKREVERTRDNDRAARGDDRPREDETREAAPDVEVAPTPEPSTSPENASAPSTSAATRNTNSNHWVIGLTSDVEEATFECSLDGGAYTSCGSTVSYRDLSEGTHTFAARSTSPGGATDPTPARLSAEITGKGRG